ncbi:MAG: hypothetical protein N2517_07105 [Ignavibacteria bacterium]|nr:hypothetical protein [Ignavibacteria bacterium]
MEGKNDVLSKLELEDLTDDLKLVASACGLDTVRQLLRNCPGMSIYVPKLSRLERFIVKYIKQNPEKSFKMLAKELGVTEQHIKRLFRESRFR